MGAASSVKLDTGAVSQKSAEVAKLLQLLSALGKSEAEEMVVESVSKAFSEADKDSKGLELTAVKPIVEAALKEHVTNEADAAALQKSIMTSVERNAISNGVVQLKGLLSIISKKMSRDHTVRCAKEKFDELDSDKSGFIDGKEISKGNSTLASTDESLLFYPPK
jgi:Ca2+-binding EF-hand superfamily protein